MTAGEQPDAVGDPAAGAQEPVAPTKPAEPARRVDPEDWSGSGEDDDRYVRERPPHWE